MIIGEARFTGLDASSFSVSSDGCLGKTLGPGSSCPVEIVFRPASPGPKVAMISATGTALPDGCFSGLVTAMVLRGEGQ